MASANGLTGLAGMPVELIELISSYLYLCAGYRPNYRRWGDGSGQPSLSRLSRTCKQLRYIVQPLLFTSFSRHDPTRNQLARLLWALDSRPDLAHNLKCFSIDDFAFNDALSEPYGQYIESRVTKLGFPTEPYDRSANGRFTNHLIELILLHTPNLQYLKIPLGRNWTLSLLRHHAARSKTTCLPRLQYLQILQYSAFGDYFDLSVSQIMTLCAAAPALQQLWTYNPGGYGYGSGSTYPVSNLRRLEFDNISWVEPSVLRDVLVSAPKLEVFGLMWNPPCDPLGGDLYEGGEDRGAYDAWDILAIRRETLREIRLDFFDRYDDLQLGDTDRTSLRDFERLEVLKAGNFALKPLRKAWRRKNTNEIVDEFLVELLPEAIVEVTFWELEGTLVPAMQRLARAAGARSSALRKVVMAPPEFKNWPYHDWVDRSAWEPLREELKTEFGRVDVRFEIQTNQAYGPAGPFAA